MTDSANRKAIRDGLAAAGVILSLLFVAYEIRQNTQVSRAASIQAMADASLQIMVAWGSEDEGATLIRRVTEGALPSDFTPDEDAKIRMFFLASLRSAESRYRQIELGLLDPESEDWFGGSASLIYQSPYLKTSWPLFFRDSTAPDFAAYMEARYDLL